MVYRNEKNRESRYPGKTGRNSRETGKIGQETTERHYDAYRYEGGNSSRGRTAGRKDRSADQYAPVRKQREGKRDFHPLQQEQHEGTAAAEESYILTGRNPIREALKTNRDLEKLLVQKGELSGSAMEIVKTAKERKIMVQVVEKSRLDDITPRHQGLIAFASAFQYSTVEEILQHAEDRGEDPFLILLDGIIVPQHRSVGLTPAAVKASAGAVEYLPIARVTNLNRTIEELQKNNIWVYALTMNGKDYEEVDFTGGTAVVIGAEGDGISKLTEEKCDLAVSLPMKGHLDSLNASVAAGVIMYRIMSSRKKG